MASDLAQPTHQRDPLGDLIDVERYPIHDPVAVAGLAGDMRTELDQHGALVLPNFFTPSMVADVLDQSLPRLDEAYFTVDQTHNVYLTSPDPELGDSHIFNHQIVSTKGCLAHDQVDVDSPLHVVYDSPEFRRFLCLVLGIDAIYPYADAVSGINVHFHLEGQELGWHFDNSSFAITALMQAPEAGGVFEYVPDLRDADNGDHNFDGVDAVVRGGSLGGGTPNVQSLEIEPGALVLFRGRNSMHRVTQSQGETPRVLVVFAYNTEPGIGLSEEAKQTFYGRT